MSLTPLSRPQLVTVWCGASGGCVKSAGDGAGVCGAAALITGGGGIECWFAAWWIVWSAVDGGIVQGRRFSDANTRASMANLEYGLQGKKQRLTSIFDYDRLDELV